MVLFLCEPEEELTSDVNVFQQILVFLFANAAKRGISISYFY